MTNSSEIFQAIVDAEKEFMAAFNQHEAPVLAALYTRDAQILPPNRNAVKGEQQLEALFREFWDADLKVIELVTDEAEGFGEIAYEVGRFALRDGGGALKDKGKYVVIWRKQDGRWKLHRDIFNSNNAEPKS